MKSSEIYRKAARRIEHGEGYSWRSACEAINDVCNNGMRGQFVRCMDSFNAIFCPDRVNGAREYYFGGGDPENQNARILALCFMAAISESEGD
jgi:hypothetical protein